MEGEDGEMGRGESSEMGRDERVVELWGGPWQPYMWVCEGGRDRVWDVLKSGRWGMVRWGGGGRGRNGKR